MLQVFAERHPDFKTFEAPESETVRLSQEQLPAYARKYYDLVDELNGMPETRYQPRRKLQEKIDILLKKHPQLRDVPRPDVGQYDINEINPVTGNRRIDEAYDAQNPAEDFSFYGMGKKGRRLKGGVGAYISHGAYDPKWDRDGAELTLRGGAVEIPQRLNRQRGLPTAYRQELAQASIMNKGIGLKQNEKQHLRKLEMENGEAHGSKNIDKNIKEATKKTIMGMGKRKQLNYKQERNEMYD